MCTHAEPHFIPTDVSHGCVAANEQRSTKLRAPDQEHQTFTLVWFDWRVQKSHREALGSRFSSVKGKHANFIPSETLSTIYSNNEAASIYMLLAGKDGIQAEAGEAAWAPPASVESVVSTQDDSSGNWGREARFGAYHTTGRYISFGTLQVVSPLRERLRWLCQDLAVTEEECRRNGHKIRGARVQPHCCFLGTGVLILTDLSIGWELPALLREKMRCPRGTGRKALLAWYAPNVSCHVTAEGFQQYFFFTQEKKCRKKAPSSIMTLVRQVCVADSPEMMLRCSTNTCTWQWKLACLWDV